MLHRNVLLTLFALASGCSWAAPLSGLSAADVNGPAAVASSAFAAQEINQPEGLQKVGTVSDSSGATSLTDLEAKLQAKATEAGASAFRITSAGGNNTLSGTADIYR